MRNLHQIEDSVLIDMLAEHTLKFTHLFRIYTGMKTSREYQNCKRAIERIISELDQRHLIPEKMSSHLKEENVEVLSK